MKKRIVLKISGEFFAGRSTIDLKKVKAIAEQVKFLVKKHYQVGLVAGGGNVFRGRNLPGETLNQAELDYVGMLGSMANGLALKSVLTSLEVPARLESTLNIHQISSGHNPVGAKKYYDAGEVIIFGGTGLPFFSTDTAAVLLALELAADILIKTTKVSGVYDKDPVKNKKAVKYLKLTYAEALAKNLMVMDPTAFALASQYNLPIHVCKWQAGLAERISQDNTQGSTVTAN